MVSRLRNKLMLTVHVYVSKFVLCVGASNKHNQFCFIINDTIFVHSIFLTVCMELCEKERPVLYFFKLSSRKTQ